MAVDTTPERSFSDLLRSSRAAEATTGCTMGASSVPRWLVVSMIPQGAQDRARGIGEEGRDAGQRLLLLGVEHVQDGAGQQRVGGLLPVVAPLRAPFRIDQDVGDVLDIAHLVRALAHLQQRIEARRARVGRDRTAGSARTATRQPAVSCQFSPLMSWMTAEPVQVSSVGSTRPTPLPERVGATARTCSGPSWRR